jgi:hypothetical protein
MTKAGSIAELRRALRESLTLQNQGSTFPKLSRAQGYVDGYMRAILDSGVCTQRELLAVVAEERARMNGPATGECGEEVPLAYAS